jgi:hypothetical protein
MGEEWLFDPVKWWRKARIDENPGGAQGFGKKSMVWDLLGDESSWRLRIARE